MILAGVDEAGLGPALGPLATASAALAVPGRWEHDSPWRELAGAVAGRYSRGEHRLVVADSKAVYAAGGAARLELTAGCFALLANGAGPESRMSVFDAFGGGEDRDELFLHPWYGEGDWRFPAFSDRSALEGVAERLGQALAAAGAAPAHCVVRFAAEGSLNRAFASGLNKNEVLLGETGRHLRLLLDRFPDDEIRAAVDKQGGRNDYLPFLSRLFPGLWIDVLEEGPATSSYRVRRLSGRDALIAFSAKADRDCFAVALASMAAKYLRERAMANFNAWFCERIPGLGPTAGYHTDARRWLAEAGEFIAAEGMDRDLLVRRR